MGSDLTAFQVHFAVEGRSVALSFVRFRHYRLRLDAGWREDDLSEPAWYRSWMASTILT